MLRVQRHAEEEEQDGKIDMAEYKEYVVSRYYQCIHEIHVAARSPAEAAALVLAGEGRKFDTRIIGPVETMGYDSIGAIEDEDGKVVYAFDERTKIAKVEDGKKEY